MKRKTLNLVLCLFAAVSLSAQTTYDVTSAGDDGTGTLRQLIGNVEAGSVINIPSGFVIVLDSAIVCEKAITINGQGSTIKVAEPGVSQSRLFTLGSTGSSIIQISLENLKLQGGDVRLNDKGTAPTHGGAILILKRVNLIMKNCEVTDSKAVRGGAIHVTDGVGVSALIEDCIFKNNSASEYGGACSFVKSQSTTDGPGEAVFKNTVFESNTSTGSAAITMNIPATFDNCLFKNNTATGTSRGSCVFQVNDNPMGNVRLNACTFAGNTTGAIDPSSNQDGGIFVAQKGSTTTYFLTNCTFYDNHGGRGAIYLFSGKMFMVNCTLTGNVAYNRSNYGGGFYATTDATVETKEAVLVNNIFAYNYSMAVPTGETDTIHRNLDMYFGARPIVYSEKNIIASARQADNAPVTIKSPVAFFYDDQDANYDDPLFENYTTNKFGHKIPAYNPETWTVALAENGVATGKALSKDMVIDPEIEALIPEKDQRGVTRSATPSLGSYEYQYPNSTDDLLFNKKSVIILSNPVKDMLRINTSLKISRLDIVDLTGKTVFSQRNPNSTVELNHIPAGHYIVRFENETGVTMEKLIVQ